MDDDSSVLFSIKEWLESEGIKIFAAMNGKDALRIVEEEKVYAAVVDFQLGMENGLSVAHMLNAADESLKIIILTGYPSHESAVESIKAGLFDYISKDTPNDKILEVIRSAIHSRKQELNEKGKTGTKKPLLKLVVACNHSLIKERLGNLTSGQQGIKVIKSYKSLDELLAADFVPEMDIMLVCAACCVDSMESAIALCTAFHEKFPSAKAVLFNEHFSNSEKVELTRMGVKGFFPVDMDTRHLEEAIRVIKNGGVWTGPGGKNNTDFGANEEKEDSHLSDREMDTLEAMALGLKNKEIAAKLQISEVTVKSHINRIYKKFGVDNRARALLFAFENDLLVKKEDG